MSSRERVFWAVVEPLVAVGVGVLLVAYAGAGVVKAARSWARSREVTSA